MRTAKKGDKVAITYVGTLSDGELFDKTNEGETFDFTLGNEEVIEGFEKAVLGLSEGEEIIVSIPPEEAYGERYEDLVIELPKKDAPKNIELELGNIYTFPLQGGEHIDMELVDINDETYVFDGNHPLAGETLNFEIKLVKIY